MKIRLTIIAFHFATFCLSQKKITGLYGKCYSGYMCQQVLFKTDSTFEFYDLLHLRGWNKSTGTWKINRDTLILSSFNEPYKINYYQNSKCDSITIKLIGNYSSIKNMVISRRNDEKTYFPDSTGILKFSKAFLDTIYFDDLSSGGRSLAIGFDPARLLNSDNIDIIVNTDKYIFNNDKWLLHKRRLYHTMTNEGKFDLTKYFIKAKIQDLKYKENKFK